MSAAVSLDGVIANDELSRRPARLPESAAEASALGMLARELGAAPRRVLQRLSDLALELCAAHSAGVSLLEQENGASVFRWHAASGRFAPLRFSTLPRAFSPCGTVLDRAAPQLMIRPERHFTSLADVQPRVAEVLLVPFQVGGELVGTVWVVAHDETRRFDSEDRRIISSLARFAAEATVRRSAAGAAARKRVLVVDDNVDAAESLAFLLRAMGHAADTAHSGLAALAALPRARPDIVMLDIVLPDLSGYEVARRMRAELGARVRIVAVSGFLAAGDPESVFDLHIVKPVSAGFLKSLLG